MKLSVVIPIYNEEMLLPEVLRRVQALPIPDKELILVDDGSSDGTARILDGEEGKSNTIVIHLPRNLGKGAAIKTGLRHVTGDVIIIQDADLEYNPEEITRVVEPIMNGESAVCYGSRFLGTVENMRWINRFANRVFAGLVNLLYRGNITDEATAYKAFRHEVIKGMVFRCRRYDFCPEVTAKILKRGYKIKEVPVFYRARTREEGKKIGWWDGVQCIWALIRERFTK